MARIKYEERLLAFIDILGFKNHIAKTISKNSRTKHDKIDAVSSFIMQIRNDFALSHQAKEDRKKFRLDEYDKQSSRQVSQFSDSLVISYLADKESAVFSLITSLYYLVLTGIQHGFFVRGCVVKGPAIHNEELLFGPALNDAVEKEKALASYPRIILDDSIIDLAGECHARQHDGEQEKEYVHSLISRDFDGLFYINYFSGIEEDFDAGILELPAYLSDLRMKIVQMGQLNCPSIQSKYLWLKEKYNAGLLKYKSEISLEQVDIDDQEIASEIHSIQEII